jgi:zinc transporter 1/2/3
MPVKAISSSTSAIESIEVGCVAHSIILGITLGLQTDLRTASVLLAVFLLHQLLEALCLSHLIASLKNRTEICIMFCLTVGSMPLGISIGLIVSESANGNYD